MKIKIQLYQNLGDTAKAVLKGKFTANKYLHQETRKISKKESNFTPQLALKKKPKQTSLKFVEGRK